jgi:transposase InsO family protein
MGMPGCPDFAFSTASAAKKRMVLMHLSSNSAGPDMRFSISLRHSQSHHGDSGSEAALLPASLSAPRACRQHACIASVQPPGDSPCSVCSETGMTNFLDP